MTTSPAPMSGRKAQAARNDEVILESARAVFTANPDAPISAVADHAKVGISALYRRYRSKDELLQRLSIDALRRHVEIGEEALAASEDAWESFAAFMRGALDAGSGSLTVRLAGRFTVTEELMTEVPRAYEATRKVLERVQQAGKIRPEIEIGDISLLLEQLQSIELTDPQRTREVRRRYLELILSGLRLVDAPPLPGPAPTWREIGDRYSG